MKVQLLLALAVGLSLAADVPQEDVVKPPRGKEVLRFDSEGHQIYQCKAKEDEYGQFKWAVRAEAKLFDDRGREVGKHFFDDTGRPTWEANDGSKVAGKLEKKVAAPKSEDIPWLLLRATAHEGEGTLSKVTFIQRVNTEGGVPPAEKPSKANEGKTVRVKYKSVYVFYED